ncbi:MAG: methyl-accepting chemotaxis protein [Pseudomonadota bacterium]|nr:methyl-accepting chemotaxis protein [Pseudomonadota bacterium]
MSGASQIASMRTRLLLAFVAFATVIGMLGAGILYAGQRALESMEKIYTQDAHGVELMGDIRNNMLEAVVASSQMRTTPQGQKAALLAAAQAYMTAVDAAWRRYKAIPADRATMALRADFERVFVPAHRLTAAYFQAMYDQDQVVMNDIDSRIDVVWNAYVASSGVLVRTSQAHARSRYLDSVDFFSKLRLLAAAAIGGGVLLAVLAYRSFVTGLLRPLDGAVRNCERIAAGDLTAHLPAPRHLNEIGRLTAAFAVMQRDLSRAVLTVKIGAAEINAATHEIAQGTLDLSHRTERQAASLEVTAANLNALSQSVQQNAGSAGTALGMSAQASAVASQGKQAVAGVIGTMARIEASASQMAQIVSVIDGIAFQTKILALNAAVEAARAGTHGRGFAVVASEVGVLAERAAAAARDIDRLIGRAGAEVSAGVEQVHGAGATMDRLLAEMTGLATIAADVAAASQRQTQDIGQLNLAVADIDVATQQNAALVEQVSAASAALAEQAIALTRAMEVFKPLPEAPPRVPAAAPCAVVRTFSLTPPRSADLG